MDVIIDMGNFFWNHAFMLDNGMSLVKPAFGMCSATILKTDVLIFNSK